MKKGQGKSTEYKLVELRCKQCGKKVKRHHCRINQFKYCSSECRELARRERAPHNKINYSEKVSCTCKNKFCNKVVKRSPSLAKNFRFCSVDCKRLYYTKGYQAMLKNEEKYAGKSISELIEIRNKEDNESLNYETVDFNNSNSNKKKKSDITINEQPNEISINEGNTKIIKKGNNSDDEIIFDRENGIIEEENSRGKRITPAHLSIWGLNKKKRN